MILKQKKTNRKHRAARKKKKKCEENLDLGEKRMYTESDDSVS